MGQVVRVHREFEHERIEDMHVCEDAALAVLGFPPGEDRVLVTTFTRNLARDIGRNLDVLCGEERKRIDVVHLYGLAVRYLRSRGKTFKLADDKTQRQLWKQAVDASTPTPLARSFFPDEWEHVVQASSIASRWVL